MKRESRVSMNIMFEFASSMVKLVSVNNGPLASNLIHVIGLKKTRDDGSTIISDTITIGREGTTTNIDSLLTRNIGYGPSNTVSIAGNVNVSMGNPSAVATFTTTSVAGSFARIAFGGGKFVVYGYLGKLYYSTNGITWTLCTYPTVEYGARILLYTGDRFLFFSEGGTTGMMTSMDGVNWNNTGYTTTAPLGQVNRGAAGNNIAILAQYNTGNISVSTNNTGVTWTNLSLASTLIYQVGFGRMSSGINVFLLVGPNMIKRNDNIYNRLDNWIGPANTPSGNWWYIGFGNDTFIITSSDLPGKLSISTNGGVAWSTPIDFGIRLKQPVYFEGYWYIGSDTFIMISKNNGVTWEKKMGRDCETFGSGNNLLVSVTDNGQPNTIINVIGLKKTRDDGSLITSDSITLNNPMTIGYTIPTLNNQLGYYTRSFSSTQITVDTGQIGGLSFAPIGPLVPGLYLATIYFLAQSDYTPYFRRIQPIGRNTPYIHGSLVTGENILFNSAGLFLEGHAASAYLSNDLINHHASGFIHITPNDTLQGTIVSYFSVNIYAAVSTFILRSYDFSVLRVG